MYSNWYEASGICVGTACSVTPAGLNLNNGSYKWHVQDYGGYGTGPDIGYQGFTLAITLPAAVLGQPSGTLTSWDGVFHWTGIGGVDWYVMYVETSVGTPLFEMWYSSADVCTGTTCSVKPAGLTLPDGSYRWRLRNYAGNEYGAYSDYQSFTLAMP
jgi:hypothetical protein